MAIHEEISCCSTVLVYADVHKSWKKCIQEFEWFVEEEL